MVDTPRNQAFLLGTSFVAGQVSGIDSQDMRDFVVSVNRLFEIYTSTSYDNDTAAASGGVPVGQIYRNGNFLCVRLT